jgi:segregation and condensation protein A
VDELNFKLESFEGPLDLLLKLISKNKVNIEDIPIAMIFEQYMGYIDEMRRMDMDVASEFIVMAAELMVIKSKMLLPRQNENEEDPRAELARALMEYKRIKEATTLLRDQYAQYAGRMVKDTDEIAPITEELTDQDISLLETAFSRLLNRYRLRESQDKEPQKTFTQLLKKKVTPVPQRIYSIMRYLYRHGKTDFEHLMLLSVHRSDLVASFMAILELVKAQRLLLTESEDGEIFLALSDVHMREKATASVTTE